MYVTGDRAWTWADIHYLRAQARYVRSGGCDGQEPHIDTLSVVVRSTLCCQRTNLIAANLSQRQPRIPVPAVDITWFNGGTALIYGFSINRLGTAVKADVSQVYAYKDVDKNNVIDPSDLLLGQSVLTANAQTLTFASPMSITAQTKPVIIVYNISLTAVADRTIGAQLLSTAAVVIQASDTVQDGFVLIGSAGTNPVYRLNPDGTVHSSYLIGAPGIGSPFVWNSRLYSVFTMLYCLNPSNLTQLYLSYGFGSPSQSSPWFDFDTDFASDPVVFDTEHNYVPAVRDEGNTGTLIWSYFTNGAIRTNPLVAGDRVIFGDATDRIYLLNRADGTLRPGWLFVTGSAINSSPAVNDALTQFFIGAGDGKFYCFDINS